MDNQENKNALNVMKTLEQLKGGQTLEGFTHELAMCVEAVKEHGKVGFVSLKLTIKPGPGQPNAFIVGDEIKSKIPQPKQHGSIMFCDENMQLTREDPLQFIMNLEQHNKVIKIAK